jgi:hypothetical protein
MKDIYNENYKTMKKEIEEETRRYEGLPFMNGQNFYCENGYTTKAI